MYMHDMSPLWWTQTQFGAIVLIMTFLTWGLVIINLALVCLILLNKLFTKKVEPEVNTTTPASPKKIKKDKILA